VNIFWQAQAEAELDAIVDYYRLSAGLEVAGDCRGAIERLT